MWRTMETEDNKTMEPGLLEGTGGFSSRPEKMTWNRMLGGYDYLKKIDWMNGMVTRSQESEPLDWISFSVQREDCILQ